MSESTTPSSAPLTSAEIEHENQRLRREQLDLQRQLSFFRGGLLVLAGFVAGFFTHLAIERYVSRGATPLAVEVGAPASPVAPAPASAQPGPPPPPEPAIVRAALDSALTSRIGRADAPVVVTEFVDFECPACGSVAASFLPQFKARWVESGTVQLRLVHWPLPMHPNAPITSTAALCAERQGKFSEYHDRLFERQGQWAGRPEIRGDLVTYARELGLRVAEFERCLDADEFQDEFERNNRIAFQVGAGGTPTFYVNGQRADRGPAQGGQMVEAAAAAGGRR